MADAPKGNFIVEQRLAAQAAQPSRADIMHLKGQATGRLMTPIIKAPTPINTAASADVHACCEQIRSLLIEMLNTQRMMREHVVDLPTKIARSVLDQNLEPTRDCIPFIYPTGDVIVTNAGSSGGYVSLGNGLKVPEGYMGVIRHVGVQCNPNGAFPLVLFHLIVSGDVQPYFAPQGTQFSAATLATPLEFPRSIRAGGVINVEVRNGTPGPVTVAAIITGFFKPLNTATIPVG